MKDFILVYDIRDWLVDENDEEWQVGDYVIEPHHVYNYVFGVPCIAYRIVKKQDGYIYWRENDKSLFTKATNRHRIRRKMEGAAV